MDFEIDSVTGGAAIDEAYEEYVKPAELDANAVMESLTGKDPGFGRGKASLPHSQPGGRKWYQYGLAVYTFLHPKDAAPGKATPFLFADPWKQ